MLWYLAQKRSRLQSMGKEEDMAVAMSKLVEDVENLNVQRFKCVLDLKVYIIIHSIKYNIF